MLIRHMPDFKVAFLSLKRFFVFSIVLVIDLLPIILITGSKEMDMGSLNTFSQPTGMR